MIWILTGALFIVILIFFSAFFAAAEMAFVTADRIKIRDKAMTGDKNAVLLEKLSEKPDDVISAIVVGNNMVNIAASILAGVVATYFFGSVGVGIATATMTLLIVIFGEATPKTYGINNEEFAFKIARHIFIIKKFFYPAANISTRISNSIIRLAVLKKTRKAVITENEIKAMLDLGVEHGTIEEDEKELVKEIFDFD